MGVDEIREERGFRTMQTPTVTDGKIRKLKWKQKEWPES